MIGAYASRQRHVGQSSPRHCRYRLLPTANDRTQYSVRMDMFEPQRSCAAVEVLSRCGPSFQLATVHAQVHFRFRTGFQFPMALRSTAICLSSILRLGPPIDCRRSTLASKSNSARTSSSNFSCRLRKSCSVSSLSWHCRASASATARPET